MSQFRQEVLKKIWNDPILFGIVADASGIKPASLTIALQRKSKSLTKYDCVVRVAKYLNVPQEEVLVRDKSKKDNKVIIS